MRPQFSEEDERRGHEAMLRRIAAEQRAEEDRIEKERQRRRIERVRKLPEPTDHDVWSNDIYAWNDPESIYKIWCCGWHEVHAKDEEDA